MKRQTFVYLFTLLFSLLPFETFVQAVSSVTVGGVALTNETPYYQSGFATGDCTLGQGGCAAYLQAEGSVANLYLDRYEGEAIAIRGYDTVNLFTKNENTIRTYGEYGIYTDANVLNLNADDYGYFNRIEVNSSTNRANGILATNGSVIFNEVAYFDFDIRSATPANVLTTDEVTGITTPLNKSVSMATSNQNTIFNWSGNFGIYTGKFNVYQTSGGNTFADIVYKKNGDYGDAVYGNDFRNATVSDNPVVSVPSQYTYYQYYNSETTEGFRFTFRLDGMTAKYDDLLMVGDNLAEAETRIVNSLDRITDWWEIPGVTGNYPEWEFDFNTYARSTRIVEVDDLQSGAYHEVEDETVNLHKKYALKIQFYTSGMMEMLGYSNRGTTMALLNGVEFDNVVVENPAGGYVLAPLYFVYPEGYEEPEEEVDTDEDDSNYITNSVLNLGRIIDPRVQDEEDSSRETKTADLSLPKAPNTGVGRK